MGLLDQIDLSKTTPSSLKAEYMLGAILVAKFFVSCYRCNFGGSKLNCLSRCFLSIWGFTDEVLGIDPIRKKCTLFFTTLDGPSSIIRLK